MYLIESMSTNSSIFKIILNVSQSLHLIKLLGDPPEFFTEALPRLSLGKMFLAEHLQRQSTGMTPLLTGWLVTAQIFLVVQRVSTPGICDALTMTIWGENQSQCTRVQPPRGTMQSL